METSASVGGMPLHWLMLIGFAIGLGGGLYVNLTSAPRPTGSVWLTSNITGPAGQIFLRLLFMLVMPLLFSALVVGVAEMGDLGVARPRRLQDPAASPSSISAIAVVIGLGHGQPASGPATASIRRSRSSCWPRAPRAPRPSSRSAPESVESRPVLPRPDPVATSSPPRPRTRSCR